MHYILEFAEIKNIFIAVNGVVHFISKYNIMQGVFCVFKLIL